jgi:hypothetical protein
MGGVMVMGLDCAWPDKSSILPGNVVRNINAGIKVEQGDSLLSEM